MLDFLQSLASYLPMSIIRPPWQCSLLVLATILVYLNSFPGAFHFDDFPLLLQNTRITDPQFSYFAFLDHYGGRPLTLWTFYWNYHLFGTNPLSYHLVSLLLHVVVVLEIYFLIRKFLNQQLLAMTTALFFSLHPLQTQAVNYIWSRSVLLMAALGLATLLLTRKHPWTALICFQLAIWSRTEAIVLILPLILLNRNHWKGPVLISLANLTGVVFSLMIYAPLEMAWNHPNVLGYWSSQLVAFWKYLALMTWPVGLNLDHHLSYPGAVSSVLALLLLLGILTVAFFLRHRHPIPVLGIFWIVTMLTPTLLVPNSDLFNESRAYLALAGFTLIMGWAFTHGTKRNFVGLRLGVAALALCLFVPITLMRNRIWKDDLTLWQDTVLKSPDKERPHYNLGIALARLGKNQQAEQEFQKAAHLNPTDDLSIAALGYCAELDLQLSAAISFYRQALQLNPRNNYAKLGLKRTEKKIRKENRL